MMALASGNPLLVKRLNYSNDIAKLEAGRTRFDRQQDRLKTQRLEAEAKIQIANQSVERLEAKAQEWKDYQAENPDWSVEIDGTPYADRKAASAAMKVGAKGSIGPIEFEISIADSNTAWMAYGSTDEGGHKRFPQPQHAMKDYGANESGETRTVPEREQARLADVGKMFTVLANHGSSLPHHAKMKRDKIPQFETDIATIDKSLRRPWKDVERYLNKQQKLEEVNTELERTGDLPVDEGTTRRLDEEEPPREAVRGFPSNTDQAWPAGKERTPVPALKSLLETEEPVSAQSIRARIAKDFELPIRAGWVPKIFDAVYKAFPEVIRVLKHRLGDLGLIAHELGHHIDEKTDILKNLSSTERVELETMDRHSTKSLVDEGFSEYLRYWLQNPGAASKNAKEFTVKWNAWIKDRTNDWGPKLNSLQVLFGRHTNMTALQQAQSLIQADGTPDRPAGETVIESYKETQGKLTAKYGRWKDSYHDFKIMDRRSKKAGYKKGKTESMSHNLASAIHNTHIAASTRAFEYGVHLVDQEGNYEVIGDSLMMKMHDLGIKGTEELARAESYIYAAYTLHMAEVNPGYDTGLDINVAHEIIENTKEADAARYKEFHKVVTSVNNDGIRMMRHAGVITKKEETLLLKDPMYIPLMRVLDGSPAASIIGKGNLLDVRSPLRSRSKLGSGAPIMSPVLATVLSASTRPTDQGSGSASSERHQRRWRYHGDSACQEEDDQAPTVRGFVSGTRNP